jgi:hypothetical protein
VVATERDAVTAYIVASSNVILAPGPSFAQAVLVIALVCLLTAREALRQREPVPVLVEPLSRVARVLTPVVVIMLLLRLLVILQ